MRVGTIVVFLGYGHTQPGVDFVFKRGDLCVVIALDDGGICRCAAISVTGEIAAWWTDMVFAEELVPLNQAPLIASAGRVSR